MTAGREPSKVTLAGAVSALPAGRSAVARVGTDPAVLQGRSAVCAGQACGHLVTGRERGQGLAHGRGLPGLPSTGSSERDLAGVATQAPMR